MPLTLRRRPVETLGDALNKVLKELQEKDRDVDGALIIRSDGLVITSILNEALDRDLVSAMAASLLNVSSRVLEELQKGVINDIVVKGEDGIISIISVNPEVVLATMAKKDANLGLLLLEMKKAKEKILKILESA